MTAQPSCESFRDDIVALLYDDGELAERDRARDHLGRCLPCRAEYADFKRLRTELKGWTLPEAATVAPARHRPFLTVPAGLAAAAGLVLGLGLALTVPRLFNSAGTSGLATPTRAAATSPSGNPATAQFVSHDELQEMLRSQERRHEADIESLRQSLLQVSEAAAPAESPLKTVSNVSPAVIERLLRESEARQSRLVDARLASLRTQTDLQRQYDMAQIAAGLAYIDSRTGADAARTSELMKNLVRVTAKPQDK